MFNQTDLELIIALADERIARACLLFAEVPSHHGSNRAAEHVAARLCEPKPKPEPARVTMALLKPAMVMQVTFTATGEVRRINHGDGYLDEAGKFRVATGLTNEAHPAFAREDNMVPAKTPEPKPEPITLCTNADLADEYHNLDDLPDDVYDKGNGMARYCAEASRKILPLASQMFPGRVISPGQLKDAAVHWALMLAFDSCRERSSEVMYSELRDYHDRKRTEAIASWQLTIK